jgi:transposase
MPHSSTKCFAQGRLAVMPPRLTVGLSPVLQQIAEMTAKIKQYNRLIQESGQTDCRSAQQQVER